MIQLSERAAAKVKSMLSELEDGAGKSLRLFVESGGCSGFQYGMSLDVPKEDDVRVESEGVEVLLDPASHKHLDECRIDFDDGLQGRGFEIINPRAKTTCGCGKSFN